MSTTARHIVSVLVGFIVVFVVPGRSILSTFVAIAVGVAVGFAVNAVLARVAPSTSRS